MNEINKCINYIKTINFSVIINDIKSYNFFTRIINNDSIKFIAKGTQGVVYLFQNNKTCKNDIVIKTV